MLMLTMEDLYEHPEIEFNFADSSPMDGVGVLSLLRFDPAWDHIEDP